MILAPSDSFYRVTMVGSRRYFYNANFVAGAFLGILLLGGKNLTLKTIPLLGSLLIVVWFLHLANGSVEDALHWQQAASLRDEMKEAIAARVRDPAHTVLVTKSLPDHVEEAYIFRSGFREFADYNWPGIRVTKAENLKLNEIDPKAVYLSVESGKANQPIVNEYSGLQNIRKNLQLVRSGKAPKVPFTFDFDNKSYAHIQLVPSGDIRVLDLKTHPMLLETTGRDPYITFAWPADALPAAYKEFRIRFEYVEIRPNVPKEDTFQVIWKAPEDQMSGLPVENEIVKIQPGIQDIRFPLRDEIRWVDKEKLQWARVDLGTVTGVKIRIHFMGFE